MASRARSPGRLAAPAAGGRLPGLGLVTHRRHFNAASQRSHTGEPPTCHIFSSRRAAVRAHSVSKNGVRRRPPRPPHAPSGSVPLGQTGGVCAQAPVLWVEQRRKQRVQSFVSASFAPLARRRARRWRPGARGCSALPTRVGTTSAKPVRGQTGMAKLRAPEDVWRRVRLAPGTEARTRPHAIVLPRERQPCTICLV